MTRRAPGLDEVAALARGLKPVARFISVASLAAAAWLGYALQSWLHLGTGWLSTVCTLLALPGLLYAWLWWLLYALGELPQRIYGAIDTVKDIRDRPPAATAMRKMGRALKDVWNVIDETDNVMLPISAALLLVNPFGWFVLAGGLGYAVLLWLSAALIGLVKLL